MARNVPVNSGWNNFLKACKQIVLSGKERSLLDECLVVVAGALGAFSIASLIAGNVGMFFVELILAFLILLSIVAFLRAPVRKAA